MNVEDEIDPSITGFVKPKREYQGVMLQIFSVGRKVLFAQATVSEDKQRNSGLWVAVALLFLLTLKTEEARRLAFNRGEFRDKALAWFESVEGDEESAINLAEEIFSQSEQTKVEVNSTGGTDPKNV